MKGVAEHENDYRNEKDVTKAVLSEVQRAQNPRLREIMSALVRHLHDFAREVKLTEEEFQAAIAYIVALGKHSNENHNEAVLMAGSLGLSTADLPPQQRRSRPDRNRRQSAWPVLAHGFAADRKRRTIVRSPTPGRCCSSMPGSRTPKASRSRASRSISGIPRPKAFTRTRIRSRPT
jgi:hypothetical protein